MSLKVEKHFECDMCNVKETTQGNWSPQNWLIDVEIVANLRVYPDQRKKLSADFCGSCADNIFPLRIGLDDTQDVPKGEFNKTWWQKFFGVKALEKSKEGV